MKSSVFDLYLSDFLNSIKQIYIPTKEELIFKEILFSKNLGFNENVVVSHQPNLFYPGVFIKFVNLIKYDFNNKLIIFNDSDKFNTQVLNKSIELEVVYEKISIQYLREFIEFIYNFLKNILFNFKIYFKKVEFIDNFSFFIELFSKIDSSNFSKFSDFIYFIFVKYFEYFGKNIQIKFDLVSNISKTIEFKKFFYDYVLNYKELNNFYNEAIDILYLNGIRTVRKIGANELPFWIISNQGFRNTLFIDENGVYFIENTKKLYVDVNDDKLLNLVRPKAVLWATFRRIFLANIDVLGIGSSYYTFISDYLFSNYYFSNFNFTLKKTDIITTTLYPFDYNFINDFIIFLDNILSIVNGILSAIDYNVENLFKIYEKLSFNTNKIEKFFSNDLKVLLNKIYYQIDIISKKVSKDLINYKYELISKISNPSNRKIKKELTKELQKVNNLIRTDLNNELSLLKDLVLDFIKNLIIYKSDFNNRLLSRFWPFFIFSLDDYLNLFN